MWTPCIKALKFNFKGFSSTDDTINLHTTSQNLKFLKILFKDTWPLRHGKSIVQSHLMLTDKKRLEKPL